MANTSKHLWLIDGSGYIFRAFYAVAPLTNSRGFPTNGLFGFVRMLLSLLREIGSDPAALVFDAGRATFRTEIYPEYKANRSAPPDELVKQFPHFRTFGAALGLPVLEMAGYEADDIIGTLATLASKHGYTTTIVSGDKDLLQLVTDKSPGVVEVFDTMKGKRYRAADVQEKFGVPPELVADVLALMGDSSDNVPGLSGVGPKTATQLVASYGSVEQILKSVEKIAADSTLRGRAKIAELIRSDPLALELSKRLVTIERQTPVVLNGNGATVVQDENFDDSIARLGQRALREDLLSQLVREFEFDSLLDDKALAAIKREVGVQSQGPAVSTSSGNPSQPLAEIVTPASYESFLKALAQQSEIAFDTETTSLDPHACDLVGASVSWRDANSNGAMRSWYLPFLCHSAPESCLPRQKFLDAITAFSGVIIGQNLKYDLQVLRRHGVNQLRARVWDTMLAAYLLNPDRGAYNLTVLARDYLAASVIEFDQVVAEGQSFADAPLERAAEYACQDARLAWQLYEVLRPKLIAEELDRVFLELEMPLVSVLAALEYRGVQVDELFLARLSEEFAGKLAALETQIHNLAGGAFNINSPKQLSAVLFDRLGLPTKGLKRTKTGVSTDASVLEKLTDHHPLPAVLLEYRAFFKLKSTYVDALPQSVSRITGRIHCKLNQTGTATGRLSSSDPNLQNIPISSAEGRRIREAFVPAKGNLFVSADYSQIELRILAHMSGDAAMQSTFAAHTDIHAATAREILHLGADAPVSSEQRRIGKTINFGIVYGMGPYRLARDLGISVAEATRYIEGYFERFPGVRKFFDGLESEVERGGAVVTLGGRKRFLSQISGEGRDPDFVRRAALNAPIQGSAADLMKRAMIELEQLMQRGEIAGQMLLQVHDELLFEIPEEHAEKSSSKIKHKMESVWQLAVPLEVKVGIGRSWGESHG